VSVASNAQATHTLTQLSLYVKAALSLVLDVLHILSALVAKVITPYSTQMKLAFKAALMDGLPNLMDPI